MGSEASGSSPFEFGEHLLGGMGQVRSCPVLQDGGGVLQILQATLELVPPVDGYRHRHGPPSIGDDERVVAQLGQFVVEAFAKLGSWG